MENTENKLAEISQGITWDNWTVEDEPEKILESYRSFILSTRMGFGRLKLTPRAS